MKNSWMKLAVVAIMCAISAYLLSIKGIRLGKDLQGGVSLVYSVKITDAPWRTANKVATPSPQPTSSR